MTINAKEFCHPFELTVCGFSNSGKTTLIEKLIKSYSKSDIRVGYLKNDAHGFQMDTAGKDTARQWQAGAYSLQISDMDHSAVIHRGQGTRTSLRESFFDCDMVLAEGHKKNTMKKLAMLDSKGDMAKLISAGEIDSIVALTGEDRPKGFPQIPFFHRDNVESIKSFIDGLWAQRISQVPLYGLVLSGGRSRRMQSDKALMNVSGQSQLQMAYQLLQPFCKEVFVSKRRDQERSGPWAVIDDRLDDFGPMGGILSAQLAHPDAAFLVLACDLPFLDESTIERLVNSRSPYKMATCFDSAENNLPEPLCAIYEPRSHFRLFQYAGLRVICPRKVLLNSPVKRIELANRRSLDNMNHPSDYKSFRREFETRPLEVGDGTE